jgi:hypothetical protein
VVSLVLTGTLAQVSSGAGSGCGALEHTGQGGGVVREGADGALAYVDQGRDDVEVGDGGELFQVTVGDVTVGI